MTSALPNPVFVASGCGGTGAELAALDGLSGPAGFVTRTITRDPRPGADAPRTAESPSGLVHRVGLQNPGLDQFLARELPWLTRQGVRVVVSVAGADLGEFTDVTRRLGHAPGVWGIELNLSSPDPAGDAVLDTSEPFQAGRVVAAVRRELAAGLPLWAKVGSDPGRVVEAAVAVGDAGADAVVVGNAVPALFPDGRPGGLSGPAIRPIALRCVREVHAARPELPVIGVGGVATLEDAHAYLGAGASLIQVGTALLHDPTMAARIAAGFAPPGGGDR